ncbi:MAG: zeta toxin family protein [Gammaproteobacteria bacterium]
MVKPTVCIWVLAGTNGAGKSSVAGTFVRQEGGDYFNPDEVTKRICELQPGISENVANSLAWVEGLKRLEAAIQDRHDYWFETTLGGNTMIATLESALLAGLDVRIWYIGLRSPELHIARVAERVKHGGHDIPTDKIRARYDSSRRNLIHLLPRLTEVRIFDNSKDANPVTGKRPQPLLILHMRHGQILNSIELSQTPEWAKPIITAAITGR